MGNCVSASKGQDSALKLDLSVGPVPDGRPSILIQSPIKGSVIGVRSLAAELDNKEEMFFDSQPWLDSDCEDYFSVCNDTPSCGNSPIHLKNSREQLFREKSLFTNAAPLTDHPGTELKKQLHELFEESFRANPVDDRLGFVEVPPYSLSKSPYSPVIISSQAPDSMKKVKPAQSPQCCISSLVRSLSFGERKRRTKSVNGS